MNRRAQRPARTPGATCGSAAGRPAVLGPLYRMFLEASVSRGRLGGLGALGLLALVVGLAIGRSGDVRGGRAEAWVLFTGTFGLALWAPVVALLLASTTLGGPREEGTLVYLWLRPVARWRIAVAAVAATLSVAAPLVVLPQVLGALVAGTDGRVVAATGAANGVAVCAYSGVFTWLGLRTRRALAVGLAYILLWEGFVAGAGAGASRLALRAYTRSILARTTGVPLRLSDAALPAAVLVPLLAGALGVWLSGRRLGRTDVP